MQLPIELSHPCYHDEDGARTQLESHRTLKVDYKTAWFMEHRIRECMDETATASQLGGDDKFVEANETYVGGRARNRAYNAPPPKKAVLSLVEREGKARSFHIATVTAQTVRPLIVTVTSQKSHFRTDESGIYWRIDEEFKTHRTVNHSAEDGSPYVEPIQLLLELDD
jgi:hypothetical protein